MNKIALITSEQYLNSLAALHMLRTIEWTQIKRKRGIQALVEHFFLLLDKAIQNPSRIFLLADPRRRCMSQVFPTPTRQSNTTVVSRRIAIEGIFAVSKRNSDPTSSWKSGPAVYHKSLIGHPIRTISTWHRRVKAGSVLWHLLDSCLCV